MTYKKVDNMYNNLIMGFDFHHCNKKKNNRPLTMLHGWHFKNHGAKQDEKIFLLNQIC